MEDKDEQKEINPSDLARLHYSITSEKDPEEHIRSQLENSDYELEKLTRGVAHYKRKSDGSNHISIKGSDPSNMKDLISDFKLGVGLGGTDRQFVRRRNQVKNIYRNNEGDNYIIGHSLGGSIGLHMLTKSKGLRSNTKQADLYNAGYSPAFDNELRKNLSKDDKKELKSKVTHHHVQGDVVSSSLLQKALGRVKKYKNPSRDPIKKHSINNF